MENELLNFFKALSDANRLKIIGLLAKEPHTVEKLAALLDLSQSTVSHHLSRLAEVGLVAARAEGYYSVYYLVTSQLEDMAQRLLARDKLSEVVEDIDLDAYDRKIIKDFSNPNGTFKSLPLQEKKFQAILRFVFKDFEKGRFYTEKEVNEIIKKYHEDFAYIRRGFIEYKMMQRDAAVGRYWIPESAE